MTVQLGLSWCEEATIATADTETATDLDQKLALSHLVLRVDIHSSIRIPPRE